MPLTIGSLEGEHLAIGLGSRERLNDPDEWCGASFDVRVKGFTARVDGALMLREPMMNELEEMLQSQLSSRPPAGPHGG